MMRSNLFRCHNLYVILLFFQLISHITRTRPCILYLRGYLIFRFFSESCKKDECRVTKTFFSCQKTSVTIKLTTFCLCGTRPYSVVHSTVLQATLQWRQKMLYMCTPGYKTGKTDICKMHYFTQDLLLAELKIIEKSLCLGKASYVSIICYYLSVTYFLLKCHCKMQVDRTFEICNKFFFPPKIRHFFF